MRPRDRKSQSGSPIGKPIRNEYAPGKSVVKFGDLKMFKCPFCKQLFTAEHLRSHKCPCMRDGYGVPQNLPQPQIERILSQ